MNRTDSAHSSNNLPSIDSNTQYARVVPQYPDYSSESFDAPRSEGPTVEQLQRLFKKRRGVILGIFLTSTILSVLYCLASPNIYTATATLEIRGYAPILQQADFETLMGKDTRRIEYQKTTTAKLKQLGVADQALATNNIAAELKEYFSTRRSLFSQVKEFLFGGKQDKEPESAIKKDKDLKYLFPEEFLRAYLGLIDINSLHETTLVDIEVETTDPALSQKVANNHAEVFIARLREERQSELKQNLQALELHAGELKQKLATTEAAVGQYARDNKLLSLSESKDESLAAKNIGDVNEILAQATAKRIKSESMLRELEKSSNAGSTAIDDEGIAALRYKLKEAETEYATLSQKVTPLYPALVELRARMDSLKKSIRDERELKINALRTEFESDSASEKSLLEQVEKLRVNANDVSSKLVDYNLLVREAASLRELTDTVLKELKQTQINVESTKSNIFVSDYAAYPRKPSAPKSQMIIIIGIILGLTGGIAAALCLEVFDNTLQTSEDAQESLRVPALGYIPTFGLESAQTTGAKKLLGYLKKSSKEDTALPPGDNNPPDDHAYEINPAIDAIPAVRTSRRLVTISSPQAAVSEALRTIRASILFSSADHPVRKIMVTSSNKGEGKTTVSTNLAVTLAQASRRTLLIDADLRHPKSAEYFGYTRTTPGLVDVLTGHRELADAIKETSVPQLHIIPPGSVSPNPAELLGSSKMGEILTELCEHYDFIVIDTPPVLPVSDSLMLANKVDGVVVVVRSGHTQRPAAQETIRRLKRLRGNVLGVVVNDAATSTPRYSVDDYSFSAENVIDISNARFSDLGSNSAVDEDYSERKVVGE